MDSEIGQEELKKADQSVPQHNATGEAGTDNSAIQDSNEQIDSNTPMNGIEEEVNEHMNIDERLKSDQSFQWAPDKRVNPAALFSNLFLI